MRALRLPPWVALALAVVVVLAGVAVAAARDDKTLDDFKRFFRKLDGRAERTEAVLALEGIQDARVVGLLVPVLGDADPAVVEAAVRVLSRLDEEKSRLAFAEALAKAKAPAQRAGLLEAAARGKFPFDEALAKAAGAALADKQWTVRLAAARAFVRLGGEEGAARVAPLAADAEPAVRAGALDALAEAKSRAVVEPALATIADPVWQVRASAIAALGTVRDARSIPVLIGRFDVEEGRLVADVAEALENLTGRAFGLDIAGWKRFWTTFGARFEMPSDAEIAKQRALAAETRARYQAPGATQYYGIDTPSRAIIFVIDVSGSMETHVVEKERYEGGGYPSMARIDIVKTELIRTIERLEPYVEFNVLAFATEIMPWRDSLVPAKGLYKQSAIDWVSKLKPLGTREDQVLVNAGLAGASNLHLGKTNTYGALMAALGLPPTHEGGPGEQYQVRVDTVFFLSDGQPTHGRYVEPHEILRAVHEVNGPRKVAIHTLALGDFDRQLMKQLAAQNGGKFVDLGK